MTQKLQIELKELYVESEKLMNMMFESLTDEHSLLKNHQLDQLEAVSTRKLNLTKKINNLAVRIDNLLIKLGYDKAKYGKVEEFIISLNDNALFNSLKNNQSLSADCQALNNKNGAIIALLSRQNMRSLNILFGNENQSSEQNIYGPDGSNKSSYPKTSHVVSSA